MLSFYWRNETSEIDDSQQFHYYQLVEPSTDNKLSLSLACIPFLPGRYKTAEVHSVTMVAHGGSTGCNKWVQNKVLLKVHSFNICLHCKIRALEKVI